MQTTPICNYSSIFDHRHRHSYRVYNLKVSKLVVLVHFVPCYAHIARGLSQNLHTKRILYDMEMMHCCNLQSNIFATNFVNKQINGDDCVLESNYCLLQQASSFTIFVCIERGDDCASMLLIRAAAAIMRVCRILKRTSIISTALQFVRNAF